MNKDKITRTKINIKEMFNYDLKKDYLEKLVESEENGFESVRNVFNDIQIQNVPYFKNELELAIVVYALVFESVAESFEKSCWYDMFYHRMETMILDNMFYSKYLKDKFQRVMEEGF